MFYKLLQIISLVVFASVSGIQTPYAQETDVFTVENVDVDITADNAINARTQAFEAAQIKAFDILAERMLDEEGIIDFKKPEPAMLSTLIDDYEVTKEKLSAVRYVGTYTFRYNKNSVMRVFAKEQKTYTSTKSPQLLILPFYQTEQKTTLWRPDNLWKHAWARSKLTHALIPTTLPLGDLQDVSDIGDHEMHAMRSQNLQSILGRYQAKDAVIVHAQADEHLSLVQHPNQSATGALTVTTYRTGTGRPVQVDQFLITAQEDQTLSQMLDTGVLKVKSFLKKDWKQKAQVITSAANASMKALIPISSLGDWASIRASLNGVGLINDIAITSLSPRQAEVTLNYTGTLEQLRFSLEQAGLALDRRMPDASRWHELEAHTVYTIMKKTAARSVPPARYSRTF